MCCPRPLVDELYKELLFRVINTKMNSLLQTAAVVYRIKSNKGVDVDVALRDRLKVYASEAKSSLLIVIYKLTAFNLRHYKYILILKRI